MYTQYESIRQCTEVASDIAISSGKKYLRMCREGSRNNKS